MATLIEISAKLDAQLVQAQAANSKLDQVIAKIGVPSDQALVDEVSGKVDSVQAQIDSMNAKEDAVLV